MRLHEAVDRRVPGCTIKTSDGKFTIQVNKVNGFAFNVEEADFQRDDWIVVPKEPEVLTKDEIFDKIVGMYYIDPETGDEVIKRTVDLCYENHAIVIRPFVEMIKHHMHVLLDYDNIGMLGLKKDVNKYLDKYPDLFLTDEK